MLQSNKVGLTDAASNRSSRVALFWLPVNSSLLLSRCQVGRRRAVPHQFITKNRVSGVQSVKAFAHYSLNKKKLSIKYSSRCNCNRRIHLSYSLGVPLGPTVLLHELKNGWVQLRSDRIIHRVCGRQRCSFRMN